jgi:hypothetical protein
MPLSSVAQGPLKEAAHARSNAHLPSTEPPRDLWRQFSLSQAAVADSSCWRSYNSSNSAGGMWPIGSRSRWLLNQSTHSSVVYSTSSSWRQGPRR